MTVNTAISQLFEVEEARGGSGRLSELLLRSCLSLKNHFELIEVRTVFVRFFLILNHALYYRYC
jgi:hypothetical protein